MSRFKVGDKVRYKGEYELRFERIIEVGDEGTVVGKGFYDEDVCVCFGVADYAPIEDLELVTPADKKREFLERLQSLMREFHTEIHFIYDPFGEEYGCSINVGDSVMYRPGTIGLSVKNIMEFDKE